MEKKGKSRTNKQNSVLRSSACPQADGELKYKLSKKGFFFHNLIFDSVFLTVSFMKNQNQGSTFDQQ